MCVEAHCSTGMPALHNHYRCYVVLVAPQTEMHENQSFISLSVV